MESLNLAIRVFPDFSTGERKRAQFRPRPAEFIVFDTETRTDATQSLLFGSYRQYRNCECIEEALFHADDLRSDQLDELEHYAASHTADTKTSTRAPLRLMTKSQFVERLYMVAYKTRSLLIGFNLPFDLSRIANDVGDARKGFNGGFSLGLDSYFSPDGTLKPNKYRPRIAIKHINSKSALKGFTSRRNPDREDLIPEGSTTGDSEDKYIFRGHFLDLRTLAFALTDKGHTLESACKAFGVANGKTKISVHGEITEAYIDYNRQDVRATAELALKLFEEYGKHPIELQDTKAYSPASIGKAYLRQMGINPILERQPDFPKHLLGFAQSAFIGGRTSAHVRKVAVPVVHTDFLSMYPTVNSNMNLWSFVTAEEIRCVEHCTAHTVKFFAGLTIEKLFIPATWTELTGFAKVIPDGDIFPKSMQIFFDQ